MPRKKKKRETPRQEQVAKAIVEVVTFDWERQGNGYETIHWLIAEHLLKDLTPHARKKRMYGQEAYPALVQSVFSKALRYCREVLKVPVWHDTKRRITYVTTDPTYRDAKEKDFQRLRKGMCAKVEAVIREAKITNPDRLLELGDTLPPLLPGNVDEKRRD